LTESWWCARSGLHRRSARHAHLPEPRLTTHAGLSQGRLTESWSTERRRIYNRLFSLLADFLAN
jgi:hypothetical protein